MPFSLFQHFQVPLMFYTFEFVLLLVMMNDIPWIYISFVSSPSGSINIWCDSYLEIFITLSSIDGQYLGLSLNTPLYIGDLSILSLIILWFLHLFMLNNKILVLYPHYHVINENGTIFSSPCCSTILEKSILSLWILAGVPVLNLLIFNS